MRTAFSGCPGPDNEKAASDVPIAEGLFVKRFFLSPIGKLLIAALILMNIPLLLAGWQLMGVMEKTFLAEKEAKLMGYARLLTARLNPGGYDELLRLNGAENASREEKIQVLHRELSGITDEAAEIGSGLGVGFYSRALDAVLTYGPSSRFDANVGKAIDPHHPGREVMRSGKPATVFGFMVRGDIMNAMYPVVRKGEVIGYVWANEPAENVRAEITETLRVAAVIMVVFSCLAFVLALLLSRRVVHDVGHIVEGIRGLHHDLSIRLPEAEGELGEVSRSINAMAEALQKADEQHRALAAAAAANAAQRNFLARMSHEIRTPMNGVLGMTRLAIEAGPSPDQLEYLKKIQASAGILLGIINDILDFSKIEAGKLDIDRHVFKPREMADNIRELILPRTREKKLSLDVTLDDTVPEYVTGDALRLSQILLNLLGNAVKFTAEGGISLSMGAVPGPGDLLLLNCMVRDTGIGMSEEEQAALFRPFAQADASISRKFGGTGLGLSISKALVELMGGEIRVSSEPGKGASFSFSVKLETADPNQSTAEEEEKPWENLRCDGQRFLLVEDNAVNQEIAEAALAGLGAETDAAGNGEEGLNAFLNKDYDVIFMDVRMPVMDGLEAVRRIRASGKADALTVPIVAMTANAMREDREESRKAGMNGHIAKPLDMDELKKTLHELPHKR
jgi:signal transduction histidine kinase/ActR/RegA family two-component response regulator